MERESRETASLGCIALGVLAGVAVGCAAQDEPFSGERVRQAVVAGEVDEEDVAVVALMIRGSAFCSGTLIAPRYVLTAAHCLPPNIAFLDDPLDIAVFFGTDVLLAGDTRRVTASWVHPSYDPDSHVNDIGLLRLDRPGPVAPIPPATEPVPHGTVTRIAGFGVTTTEGSDNGLRRMGTVTVAWVGERDLTLLPAPSNTCYGDSGGPTFGEIDGEERVIGVHSYLFGSCGVHSVDTRVDVYLDEFRDFVLELQPTCRVDDGCVRGCDEPDPDCLCIADGACDCPAPEEDTDCIESCDADEWCNRACGSRDPDCPCSADATCDTSCPADPDCTGSTDGCETDGVCSTECPLDLDCATYAHAQGGACSAAGGFEPARRPRLVLHFLGLL